ncbi:MAG: hypothetical protein DSY37_03530 [Hyperthermus sp.]|nr:MAG: hypothetical protein DSY37_03530 [Hyperthermus sp.]
MHEVSIALSMLSLVEDAFRRTPGARRVSKIRIEVGLLSLVDVEALRFALRTVARGTPAENAVIEIMVSKPVFRCRKCGYQWSVSDSDINRIAGDEEKRMILHIYPDVAAKYFTCPRCGGNSIDIVKGRGVVLLDVEIETA